MLKILIFLVALTPIAGGDVGLPAGCQTFDKIGGDRLPACGVALQRLIAAPEQFSHMRVRTYGYISYSNHHAAALYPARFRSLEEPG